MSRLTLTTEERLENVENHSGNLENILGKFIVSTSTAMLRLENSMKDFKEEMQDFKDEMRDFKGEMTDFKDEMKDFKDEMKDFKDEMKDFKDESERDRKEMNRKWGELANKMGTVVEDIVAPNIPRIAREYFDVPELDFFALRVRRKHSSDRSLRREFDIAAVSDKYLFINETKSTPRPEYAREFKEILSEIPKYFPEYYEKILIPFFFFLNIPQEIQSYLSRNGIYALAMNDDTMDILNFEDVGRE